MQICTFSEQLKRISVRPDGCFPIFLNKEKYFLLKFGYLIQIKFNLKMFPLKNMELCLCKILYQNNMMLQFEAKGVKLYRNKFSRILQSSHFLVEHRNFSVFFRGVAGYVSFQSSKMSIFITKWKIAPYKADPMWAPFTALRYKQLGLLISVRELDLPISLRLTDSVKQWE